MERLRRAIADWGECVRLRSRSYIEGPTPWEWAQMQKTLDAEIAKVEALVAAVEAWRHGPYTGPTEAGERFRAVCAALDALKEK